MKTIELMASWLIIAITAAPASLQAAGRVELEAQITTREESMHAALAANDAARYFSFFAQDMSAIFYDQSATLPVFRQSWNDAYEAGRRIRTVKLGAIQVRLLSGNAAAIATFPLEVTIDHPDGDISTEHAFQTDVWVKRKSGWQLLHTHFAVATPPAH